MTDRSERLNLAQVPSMVPGEISGRGAIATDTSRILVQVEHPGDGDGSPRETNGAGAIDSDMSGMNAMSAMREGGSLLSPALSSPGGEGEAARGGNVTERVSEGDAEFYAKRKQLWESWLALQKRGFTYRQAAAELGVGKVTLWRLIRDVASQGDKAFESDRHRCGRKPAYRPTEQELQCVREIYSRLDESEARGRGLGSSKVTAYRLAAKSEDPRIGDEFRRVVLQRNHKAVPPSWERLLDTPASVLEHGRDSRSTMANYISTPRGRTWVNEEGEELVMRAGTIFEADDGTFNFYAYIPWPFGGDRCSDKYGVKLGRWQLLAVVDARWEYCPSFDIVARNFGSYRGEDSGALLGRTMAEVCKPVLWRLERGSWESNFVRDALSLCQVKAVNAWHSKQKSAVERFFDRFWTPASLIQGHCGRDRGRYKHVTDLGMACQDGRRDPREHFLALSAVVPRVIGAIQFTNSEPIESKSWGRWVPQERFEAQMAEDKRPVLDPALRIFFSREQRVWTVRGCLVGGKVDGPAIKFPIYFQCQELWEFEGCRVKAYFDPYAEPVLGTLVLQDEWRSYKPGYVIARDVPALDLPPQVVLATDGWADDAERERSLQIRKAIAKAVRTESWSWRGMRSSEARDGLGNVAKIENRGSGAAVAPQSGSTPAAQRVQTPVRRNVITPPSPEEWEKQQQRFTRRAALARSLTGAVSEQT